MPVNDGKASDLASMEHTLDLVDYRRKVAALYDALHVAGVGPKSWQAWRDGRQDLFLTHPASPLLEPDGLDATALPYFDYDPSWNVVGTVEPIAVGETVATVAGGPSIFEQIGSVVFDRDGESHRLALFWLAAYGGGLLLPFRDTTNGTSTYGAGRYLLDGAKSADMGSPGPNQLALDFNFAYHPSCMWDPQWPCPLAPKASHLTIAVEAGEQKPEWLP